MSTYIPIATTQVPARLTGDAGLMASSSRELAESQLYFRSLGSGQPIVFLHGALTTHADWPPELTRPLARDHQVILVDRPGHGRSLRPRFLASPKHQAMQVRQGLALEEPAILVAHSHAGAIALAFAEMYPELTAGLVLVSPLCLPEFRLIELAYLGSRAQPGLGPVLSAMAHGWLDDTFLRLVHAAMFAPQPIDPAWQTRYEFDRVWSALAFLKEGEDSLAASPFNLLGFANLANVRAPVRFVLGERDVIVDHLRHAAPASVALRNATLTWVRGVGHMVHVCRPELVLNEIRTLTDPTLSAGHSSVAQSA